MKVGEVWELVKIYDKDDAGNVIVQDVSEENFSGDSREATIDSIKMYKGEYDNWIGFHYGNNSPNCVFTSRASFVVCHIFKRDQ